MKKGLLNKILAAVLSAVMVISVSQVALAEIIVVNKDEFLDNPRAYRQNFTFVDLRGVATRAFADEVSGDGGGGWSDQGPTNDMSIFKSYGTQNFAGIEFDIINPKENDQKSCIMMKGRGDINCPSDIEIPVNATAKGIYFLNCCPYGSKGLTVGTYTMVYDAWTPAGMLRVNKTASLNLVGNLFEDWHIAPKN